MLYFKDGIANFHCDKYRVLVLYFELLTIIGLNAAAYKIIVGRGHIKVYQSPINVDLFSYTNDNICGNTPFEWCQKKDAYDLPRNTKLVNYQTKCSCKCNQNYKTYFINEERCVSINYLRNHSDFGTGQYFFDVPVNLSKDGELDTSKSCNKCKIDKVMYYTKNRWQIISNAKQTWSIDRNGSLRWMSSSLHNETKGKILMIKLKKCEPGVRCSWTKGASRIFCKSKGDFSIDVAYSSSTLVVPSPSLTRWSVMTSSIQATTFTTSKPALQVSSTSALKTSLYMSSSHKISQTSTSDVGPLPFTVVPTPKEQLEDEVPSSIGAIVGAVVVCFVVFGIIVFLIVWRRRKQGSRRSPQGIQEKKPPVSSDNPMYGQNQGEVINLQRRQDQVAKNTEEEEYVYAAVDGDHSDQKPSKTIYQSLVKEPVGDSVYASLNKGTPEEYSYNHLEHPAYNPPHSKGVPSEYAALQRPSGNDYLEPGVNVNDLKGTSEPVYNVLEDPQPNQAPQDNEPVYNVLEDPDANQAPINKSLYNVLEDPDADYDNASIKNDQNHPASGQDNIAYSSTIDLNIPQAQSCPDHAVLEEPEDPGGTIPESTYQPLDIRVQDDGVYQPLERTSRSIYQSLQQNDSTA